MKKTTTKHVETKSEELINTAPKKRKGRLKKGEKVEASGHKTMSMEEAYKSVEGMKHKIANKYKVFCNASVSYEDLISAANIGLAWAYRDWDSKTAKFTTFSHNRMERQIDLYLCEMLPKYKNNVDAKNWLRRKNDESFKQLMERGITKDETFNNEHGLDGEKPFTKEHYNLYTQKVANSLFNNGNNLVITSASGFQNGDNEDFNIFDALSMEEEEKVEDTYDITELDDIQKEIASMIMEGFSISEIAKKFGVTKAKLVKMAGVKDY
jgi:DNA-directed RNA polymerase specialized sigma subunit